MCNVSNEFIKKDLFVDVIPKFAVVKKQFINDVRIIKASRKLMKSHLAKMCKIFRINQCNIMIRKRYFIQTLVLYLAIHLSISHKDCYQNVVIYLLKQKNKR